MIAFRLYAFVGYFSFCILIEKYNADDDIMKHVLKEKVSYCQVPPDYVGNPLTYKFNNPFTLGDGERRHLSQARKHNALFWAD